MLYDILPPLIFFASLGGVIFILSRVVLRWRAQIVATNAEAVAASVVAEKPEHFLRPSQRSVQAMRSRLGLIKMNWQWRLPVKQWAAMLAGFVLQGVTRVQRAKAAWQAVRAKRAPAPAKKVEPQKVSQKVELKLELRNEPKVHLREVKKESVLDQANQAIAAANFQQAEDMLVSYIVDHTRDAHAYMLLGRSAAGKKNWPEAMEIFEQVVCLDTGEPEAWGALGEAAYHCGKFTKALPALQRAHNVDRANVNVLHYLLAIAKRMDNQVLQHSVLEELAALPAADTEHANQTK